MFWMKRRRGKRWHTLYKEGLFKLQEVDRHLSTVQQKYISAKEQIMDLTARYNEQLEIERAEAAKKLLRARLYHEEQIKEIKIELSALQIELQRVKVKDDIARTTEGLIAQCVKILGGYARGIEPGDKKGALVGTALDALKSSYQRDHVLRKQAVENAFRRVGHPGNATDLNRAMYGLGGSPLGNVHITGMGKWPEAGMSGEQPTGDPQAKVNIDRVYGPGVKLDECQEAEPKEPLAPARFAPENTRPDPKGT